ncbi:flagellar motor protein MotB [Sulfurospirillum sp. 1612]|uniref:flagellar motor protein MotB n=1 Tax=Sulfurospirillum sp. 1612 TaxID=3094835 RepID=UPI002F91FA3F
MRKKAKPCDCPKCLPAWLAAFGDLMSLLLCFFVLLLSMSTMDAKKVQEAIGSLAGALSVLEGGTKTEISRERQQQTSLIRNEKQTPSSAKSNIEKTILEVNQMLKATGSPQVVLEESQKGFVIRLPGALLFKPGSAVIENEDAILFLKRISLIIEKLPKDLHINVIGYTDNTAPDVQSAFRDNWDLSSARGVSVVKELIKDNVSPKRLMASGKAQYDPIASNTTEEGRTKNRRVELSFFTVGNTDKSIAQKSILDMNQQSK